MAQRLNPNLGVFALRDEHGAFDHARMLSYIFNLEQQLRETQAALTVAQTALEQEKTLSRRDALTGLPNRRALIEHLEGALQDELKLAPTYTPLADGEKRSETDEKRIGVAIGFIDLDGFKAINDTHGHDAGDAVLREVGDFLERKFRETDAFSLYQLPDEAKEMAGRLGGDEFLLVLRHTDAQSLSSRRIEIEADLNMLSVDFTKPDGKTIKIPIRGSLGLVDCDLDASAETNLDAADKLMYARKQERKQMRFAEQGKAMDTLQHALFPTTFRAPSP